VIEIYNKILDIDPHNADAYYNLGIYYFNSGDIANAERFFSTAVEINDHLNSHLYLGHIFESKGMLAEAIAEYRIRIRHKRGPKDPYAEEARKRIFQLMNPDSSTNNP
jgi:tetratricopeptide (TPR) repeat protein